MEKTHIETNPKEKQMFDPQNDIIYISHHKPIQNEIFLCKIVLKKFGTVRIQSLGNASERAV